MKKYYNFIAYLSSSTIGSVGSDFVKIAPKIKILIKNMKNSINAIALKNNQKNKYRVNLLFDKLISILTIQK